MDRIRIIFYLIPIGYQIHLSTQFILCRKNAEENVKTKRE